MALTFGFLSGSFLTTTCWIGIEETCFVGVEFPTGNPEW